jgi:hypothetical protein
MVAILPVRSPFGQTNAKFRLRANVKSAVLEAAHGHGSATQADAAAAEVSHVGLGQSAMKSGCPRKIVVDAQRAADLLSRKTL